jgi:hypothetical protein
MTPFLALSGYALLTIRVGGRPEITTVFGTSDGGRHWWHSKPLVLFAGLQPSGTSYLYATSHAGATWHLLTTFHPPAPP